MRDEALTGLLNVRTRSYLLSKTSHRFASPVGESGIRILLRALFVDIFLQNLRRQSIFPYRADVARMNWRCD
jgi:hypothetical protein